MDVQFGLCNLTTCYYLSFHICHQRLLRRKYGDGFWHKNARVWIPAALLIYLCTCHFSVPLCGYMLSLVDREAIAKYQRVREWLAPTTGNNFLAVLQVGVSRSWCHQGWSLSPWPAAGLLLPVPTYGLFSAWTRPSCLSVCPNFLLFWGHQDLGWGPTLSAAFKRNNPLKGPVSKRSHIVSYWALELEPMNFGRVTVQLMTLKK